MAKSKGVKQGKLATRIAAVVIGVLIISMTVLVVLVTFTARKAMEQSAEARMKEAAEARAALINNYFGDIETFLAAYAVSPSMIRLAENQDDPEAFAEAKRFTDEYAARIPNLENIYMSRTNTYVLCGHVDETIGKQSVTDQALLEMLGPMYEAMGQAGTPMFSGVMASPTGDLGIIFSYPVMSGNKMVAVAGISVNATGLINQLSTLSFDGWDKATVSLVDVNNLNYTYSDDQSLIGTTIEESSYIFPIMSYAGGESGVESDRIGNQEILLAYSNIPSYGITVLVQDTADEVYASMTSMTEMVIIMAIIVIVLITAITFVVINILLKDLTRLSNNINDVSSSLDLTQTAGLEKYAHRHDEVGMVSNSTLGLIKAITDIASALKTNANGLRSSANELDNSATSTEQTALNITESVAEIAEGASSQAETIQEGVQAVADIVDSVQNLNENITGADQQAEEMSKSSKDMLYNFENLGKAMDETQASLVQVSESMAAVDDFVNQVQEAADAIDSIANQTNLLSLNASIEAARAGEAGRGFAVVAEEIGNLSEQSGQAAHSIGEIMQQLSNRSKEAVATVDDLGSVVEKQQQISADTRKAVTEVISMIDEVRNSFTQAKDACLDMKNKSAVIEDTMSGLSAISEENAASSQETSASMEQVNNTVKSIKEMAFNLTDISDELNESLSRFKL